MAGLREPPHFAQEQQSPTVNSYSSVVEEARIVYDTAKRGNTETVPDGVGAHAQSRLRAPHSALLKV